MRQGAASTFRGSDICIGPAPIVLVGAALRIPAVLEQTQQCSLSQSPCLSFPWSATPTPHSRNAFHQHCHQLGGAGRPAQAMLPRNAETSDATAFSMVISNHPRTPSLGWLSSLAPIVPGTEQAARGRQISRATRAVGFGLHCLVESTRPLGFRLVYSHEAGFRVKGQGRLGDVNVNCQRGARKAGKVTAVASSVCKLQAC